MNRAILAMLLVGIAPACSEIPDETPGDRILGTVTYEGSAHLALRRPAIRVMLDLEFPPVSDPIAFHIIEADEQPSFPLQARYELKGIDPYRYKLLAQLVDLAAPGIPATSLPLGGYPDFCSLLSPETGWVEVRHDQPITQADFQLYDRAGAEDPCNTASTVCPRIGQSSLNLTIRSSRVATGNDQLIYALFSTFPSLTPTRSKILAAKDVTFPQSLFDNALAPGDYAALYICLDVGGNSGSGMCTDEDAFVLATPSTPLTFLENHILNVTVNLDERTMTVQGADTPADHGCVDASP
jgi:hypothetical protein